jgi:ankyrin repeat protein/CRP-like cAMP-binding protein
LYWAFVTIATIGFGDISPQTDKEFMLFIAFVMLNIFLTAWVLGNVTLLVTQNDESTRLFREKFVHLEKYMKTHYLPEEMRDTLRDYMKLQYNMAGEHREALDLFPNVFKSTVNRFLFRPIIDSSFLKSITSDNFRDSLASEMTLELLMPDTDIITQFDTSHEMYIIASGTVQVFLDVDAQEFETKTSEPLDTLSECPDDEEADGSDDDDNNEDDDEKHELTVNEKACSMREGSISSKRESGIEMLPRTDLRSTSAESAYSAKHASKFASRYGSIDLAALDDDDDDQSGYSSPRSPKGGFVRPPLHKQGTMKLLLDVVETITNVVEDETEVEIEKAAASQKQKKQEKISIGTLTDGACIGEVPFLFKLQQPLHIRTKTICRLLVLKRDSWNSLRAVHPFDSRQVVLNVAQRVKTESFEFEGNGHHEPRDRGFFGSGKGASCHHDHHDHHDTPDGTNPSHPQSPLPPPCHSKDNIEDMQKRSALHEMYKTLSDLVSNELAISEKDQVAELCYAAVAGNVFTMRQILSSADFSVNNSDYDGRTALHAASAKGVTISVKYLLERRADVNCLDNFGVTPLFEAVRNGHEEVARLLFKHGGNLGLTDANHTVLDIKKQMDAGSLSCLVASRDDAEHLDRLLRYGLNPNACDYDGRTGLHIAAALGNHSIMEVFLKYGANPSSLDYFGRTPLLEAVRAQQEPCCRLLMSKGGELGLLASLEDRKESCGTPRRRLSINPTLLRSMSIDRDSASTAGKSKSSPKKSPGKGSGMTTVIDHKKTRMLAGLELCMAAYEDDTRYLRTLLQFGCPVNSSDYDGRTAAHICCAGNLLSPALTLIDFGADFNSGYIKDRWGRTPLEEAYLNNHHELASTIESLLKLKLREGSYVDDERSDTKSNEGKDTRSNDGTSVDGNGAPRRPSVPLMRPPQELLGKEQSPPVKLKKKGSTGTLRKLFSNNK